MKTEYTEKTEVAIKNDNTLITSGTSQDEDKQRKNTQHNTVN